MRASLALALAAFITFAGCTSEPYVWPPPTHEWTQPVTLYLVRHGESYKNVAPLPWMNESDRDRLTPKGQDQARAAGRFLARSFTPSMNYILTSPRGRARETASFAATVFSVVGDPNPSDALLPLREGKAPDGKATDFAWHVAQWKAGADPRPDGGESLADVDRRASAEVERSIRLCGDGLVLVAFTHGDVIAALLGRAAGTPMTERWAKHEVPTGSVSAVEVSPDGHWRLVQQATAPTPSPK